MSLPFPKEFKLTLSNGEAVVVSEKDLKEASLLFYRDAECAERVVGIEVLEKPE